MFLIQKKKTKKNPTNPKVQNLATYAMTKRAAQGK